MVHASLSSTDVVNHVVSFCLPRDYVLLQRAASVWRGAVEMRFATLDGIRELMEALPEMYPEIGGDGVSFCNAYLHYTGGFQRLDRTPDPDSFYYSERPDPEFSPNEFWHFIESSP
eukprot:gnl/MRDRNA2_/MRDRNA2_194208_c0_seq1.p2 gnl/MRDRNA2_/MRDRNA2_194208_c0~~gnl/MRDRNA2_/MRDRNA2_194208_c0_seq1.p2  ORF type:complete len:136 (-),score=13.87 gnl/MRDRNA2_/MRDRNA2_194208_c0_seq1:743-1090(-)